MRLHEGIDMKRIDKNGWENAISVALLRSKGAESRRKILEALLPESESCNQIARETKLNWRTVKWHLQVLQEVNLVKSIGFGQRKYYQLTLKGEEVIEFFKNRGKSAKVKNS